MTGPHKIIVETLDGRKEVETEKTLPCLVCRKPLWNEFYGVNNQPHKACTFNTHGHYGSAAFDSIDGAQLEINVCDGCLTQGRQRGDIGYWPGLSKREMKQWEGE